LRPPSWPEATEGNLLGDGLAEWVLACPRRLVLFFDEIDALRGQALIRVLSQLRDGYRGRPGSFPASVALCGLRDIPDHTAASGGGPSRLGTSSPLNIKLESLRLGEFAPGGVGELYAQYTADIGQVFTSDAVIRSGGHLTAGQLWLVNALAREIVGEMAVPASEPVAVEHVDQARQRLVLARATHLDSLAARLVGPRACRVSEGVYS
jgi:hypothetical protein